MKGNAINLSKFLSRYAHVEGKNLTKVTHKEVKALFPNITRCSFDVIEDNPNLIYEGVVVLVNDGKTTIPYYVPSLDCEDNDYLEFNREEDEIFEPDDTVYDYEDMSVYELRCLLRRKFNSYRNQTCARRELNRRGIVLKKKYDRNSFKRMEN